MNDAVFSSEGPLPLGSSAHPSERTEHQSSEKYELMLCCPVKVKIKMSMLDRPITKVCLLQLNETVLLQGPCATASNLWPPRCLRVFRESESRSAMGKLSAVICCLLLTVRAATAQTAQSERLLPQWLTGIIAVAGFLFLSFVGLLVKKAWCEEPRRREGDVELVNDNEFTMTNSVTYDTNLDVVRSKENMNVYENPVVDSADEKVTSM
ncbi:PDZK1-interacting protein 1 [Thunnus maccoyii]|uniref:PDZK1-interacting protein 1 n=1 Tax=Thunnus maccoyii TaxID=8240 RepID=UPI001C4C39A2|nr:PDZK1-interacting protein 1 [Thunnus maccoyii]